MSPRLPTVTRALRDHSPGLPHAKSRAKRSAPVGPSRFPRLVPTRTPRERVRERARDDVGLESTGILLVFLCVLGAFLLMTRGSLIR